MFWHIYAFSRVDHGSDCFWGFYAAPVKVLRIRRKYYDDSVASKDFDSVEHLRFYLSRIRFGASVWWMRVVYQLKANARL